MQIAVRARDHPVRRHHHRAARRGGHPGRAAERQGRPRVRHRRGPAAAQDDLQAGARRLRDRRRADACSTGSASPATSRDGVEQGLLDPRLARAVRPRARSPPRSTRRDDDLLRYIGVVTHAQPLRASTARNGDAARGAAVLLDARRHGPVAQRGRPDDGGARASTARCRSSSTWPPARRSSTPARSYPQLSNCFVMQMEDDIEHIAKTVRDVMWLTKGTGGIGLSVTKLRVGGLADPLEQHDLDRADPVHAHDRLDAAGGLAAAARSSARCASTWRTGTSTSRSSSTCARTPATRTAAPARRTPRVWISDEFMKRVAARRRLVPVRPARDRRPGRAVGAAFSARYAEYVAMAEAGRLRDVPARSGARAVQGDPHRAADDLAPVADLEGHDQHPGAQRQHRHDPPVQPVHRDHAAAGPGQRRGLQPGVDQPVAAPRRRAGRQARLRLGPARGSARARRAPARQPHRHHPLVGAGGGRLQRRRTAPSASGVMGFTDVVERLGFSYESEEAYDLDRRGHGVRQLRTPSTSQRRPRPRARRVPELRRLAAGRTGMVPLDTHRAHRGRPRRAGRGRPARPGWTGTRCAPRSRGGMRNATLMAIAPTASIGLVAGTTPGLDPQFSQIFSRRPRSGKFLEVNRNLVARPAGARPLGAGARAICCAARATSRASTRSRQTLQGELQDAFQLSPYAFLEVAARAQKWIDQAISRNMYLETRDLGDMMRHLLRRPGSGASRRRTTCT